MIANMGDKMRRTEVKKIREELNVSQYKLANLLGVTQGAVAMWESGKRQPSATVVKLLKIIRNQENRQGGKKST